MELVGLAAGIVVLVAAIAAAKRAGWLDGSAEDLRRAERAEEAARARPEF